ncbi:MAG: hypothetical protein R2827_11180 [Bdellovibrionales bacterium]
MRWIIVFIFLLPLCPAQADEADAAVAAEIRVSPDFALRGISQSFTITHQSELDTTLKNIYSVVGDDPVILTVHDKTMLPGLENMMGRRLKSDAIEVLDEHRLRIDLRHLPWMMRTNRGRILWTTVKIGTAYFSWIHFGPDGIDPSIQQGGFIFAASVLALFSTPFPRDLARFYRKKFNGYLQAIDNWEAPEKWIGNHGKKIKFIVKDAPIRWESPLPSTRGL